MKRIVGLKSIAAALGVSEDTVITWARLRVDPMPLRCMNGHVWIYADYLEEWSRRRALDPTLPIAEGWAHIIKRLGLGVSQDTAHRWSCRHVDPLPVVGVEEPGRRRGKAVWVYDGALRDWCWRNDRGWAVAHASYPSLT